MIGVAADKITMIPYGSDRVDAADAGLIVPFGVEPGGYAILIARAEPENSILEVVRAWSRKPRGCKLLVLGHYEPDHAYQRAVQAAASSEVVFPGAIYDKAVVQALRFHARFYVHGHTVGGTNPSLVEALGAGNAVLAHDNSFNRWVAGEGGVYFRGEGECAGWLDRLVGGDASVGASTSGEIPPGPPLGKGGEEGAGSGELLSRLRAASRARHGEAFTWERVLGEYEGLLAEWAGR